jgi:hypothetical protein
MFNLFKVSSFLQSVPSFAEQNMRLAAQDGQPLSYSPKKDKRVSPVSKGEERAGKQSKGKNNKKDDDNNNDNNNGGFL